MRRTAKARRCTPLLAIGFALLAASSPDAGAEPALEARALDIVKAMSARLAAAQTMSFTATSTYESPSRLGAPLAYTVLSQVTMQRPDKLRVISPGDGPASEFFYDGKTITAFAPAENVVAVAPAPPTIDAAIKLAFDSASIYFPFSDVVVADPFAFLSDGLVKAFYVGQSRVVGGTVTDIVVLVNERVFGQFWIGAEDKLPRQVRAIYADDPAMLRQQVEFSDWKLDVAVPADAFTSPKAAGATRIAFTRPDAQPPAEALQAEKAAAQGSSKPKVKK